MSTGTLQYWFRQRVLHVCYAYGKEEFADVQFNNEFWAWHLVIMVYHKIVSLDHGYCWVFFSIQVGQSYIRSAVFRPRPNCNCNPDLNRMNTRGNSWCNFCTDSHSFIYSVNTSRINPVTLIVACGWKIMLGTCVGHSDNCYLWSINDLDDLWLCLNFSIFWWHKNVQACQNW